MEGLCTDALADWCNICHALQQISKLAAGPGKYLMSSKGLRYDGPALEVTLVDETDMTSMYGLLWQGWAVPEVSVNLRKGSP